MVAKNIPKLEFCKEEPETNESLVPVMVVSPDFDDKESSVSSSDRSSEFEKEPKDRATWIGKMDFLLSCIGYAVGLGNIWRFPFLCYESGGGAFLVPYFIFLFLCGMPLFFLELSFGQFGSQGPISIWNICPLFKGLGYAMVILSGIVCIYYNIIITWILYYMYLSFNKVLPWSTCGNNWNTENCYLHPKDSNQNITGKIWANFSMSYNHTADYNGTIVLANSTEALGANSTIAEAVQNISSVRKTPSEEFWMYNVLDMSKGIEELGGIRWELFVCLIIAWIVIFGCLFRGVKSSGRVVYFSATFPYIVLIILFIRSVTLPGAWKGIVFYLSPKWSELKKFSVWGNAAIQIFYSLGPAWGGLLTMSSYNKFHNNVYRDAMMVPLINCGTSVFAGLVIFSVIGFMAETINTPIEKVISQGPGLVFVVYPQAVTNMPLSPLWAFMFFFMIFTVGLDSQFGMFETTISAFVDEFPKHLRRRKTLFIGVVCVLMFLLGIPLITRGGIYIFMLMDWYCSAFALMFISLAECIVVSWIYGVDRFMADISMMVHHKIPIWWKISWKYTTPTTILFIMFFTFKNFKPLSMNNYSYPGWAIGIGWIMAILPIIPIPVLMIIQIINTDGNFCQRIKKLLTPSPHWGPILEENRSLYKKSINLLPPRFMPDYVASRIDDVSSANLKPPSYSQIILADVPNV